MGFFDFFNSKKGDKRADDGGAAGSGAIFPADSSDDADGAKHENGY